METYLAVMVNYVYQLDSYCTSIVAKLQNGTIVHVRNLDFYFANKTRDITYIAKFYKGDKYLFEAVMFGGVISTYTGYKEGSYSVTLNQRYTNSTYLGLLQNIGLILLGNQ
jgi:hypothetical protein